MKQQGVAEQFEVVLFSFGFKYGTPEDVNLLFDVRFLPNPYWEEEMRHLTGHDAGVAAYVLESESGRKFLCYLEPLLRFLISGNRQAGKEGIDALAVSFDRLCVSCQGVGAHGEVLLHRQCRKDLSPLGNVADAPIDDLVGRNAWSDL